MHTTMLLLLFVLFVDGVSGADPDQTLSVREGDSVTLPTDLTEILNDHTILWKFGPKGSFISQITRKNNFTSLHYTDDVRFKGRLQVDQNTGSLTIRNTRERHSGQYQVTISRVTISKPKTFNVTVQRVASGSVKSKSVMEGEPVTLNPDKTQIHGDDLVLWRFGDILLAKIDVENKQISLNDADEIFRGRLQLDQTGSLTVTNTRTTDSGLYHLQIRGRESSQQFFLTVSQPGGKAGIVVAVLLFLAAVAAAAAAVAVGFIYYRRKISELQKQILTVIVKEGDDVPLKPNKTIQKGDGILWMFGEEEQRTSIAKFIRETGEIVTHDDAADGRFRDRLDLDKTTGSLTIRYSRPAHSGLYTLYITSSRGDSQQRFFVTVSETLEEKSVDEDGTVTLKPDTEIQRDDQIQWIFGDQYNVIAEIREETGEICIYDDDDDVLDGRFKGRLKLEKTGSLTITNITPEHAGLYKLLTINSRGTLFKRFRVYMQRRSVSVIEGESVHLSTDRPKIERDDVIQWRFGDEIIAEIKEGTGKTHDGADGRFRDRLQLDKITGDLTIKSSTAEHTGYYNLNISSRKGNTDRTYRVIIPGRHVFVTEGKSVHLSTDRPKIERDDVIQWRFRDEIIAEIKGGTGKTHDGAAGRFRDRLQLDKRTGDLTIKSSTDEDAGRYKLNIRSRKGNTDKIYHVIITGRHVFVTEGESVHLFTDRPKIERDDEIQWRFGDENSLIAEIKGGTGETHDGAADGRFRDRLQLNDQTGDLTIKNSTAEHTGRYKLKISSRKGNKNWTYSVIITCKATGKPQMKGNNDESVVEMQPLLDK